MRRPLAFTLFVLFFAAIAPRPARADWKQLSALVSSFLTGEDVRRAHRVVAVAAVRDGRSVAPTDQDEDLDQLLLDGVSAQRARLGSGSDAALRRLYSALAVSYWTQAYAASQDADMRKQAAEKLAAWASAKHEPRAPQKLDALLRRAPGSLDAKALVAAGWGRYARSLVPSKSAQAAPGAAPSVDAETAKLDEMLAGLRDSWSGHDLQDAVLAKSLLLTGDVAQALSQAPLKVSADAPAAASAAPAAVSGLSVSLQGSASDASVDFVPRKLYDSAAPSVVVVICSDPSEGGGELGSGSVIDSKGHILTNAHVVVRDSTKQPWPQIRVYLKPARMTGDAKADLANPVTARVVKFDRALDLAVLDVGDAQGRLPAPIALGDPDAVSIGDRVAAIGHPEQGGLWTLTTGVISTVVADIGGVKGKNAFQTDASINRGNSGGPLLDAHGRIVGVNTSMSRKASDGLAITSVNFAVRSDVVAGWLGGGKASASQAIAAAEPPAQTVAMASPAAPASLPPANGHKSEQAPRSKPKKQTITESKPFSEDELIQREIQAMEDLGNEMHQEILKHSR